MDILLWIVAGLAVGLALLALHDLFQPHRVILRTYPIVGRGRHWLAELGPKLRQYIVAGNNEERPFNRDQRRWIYDSAEQRNNYFGFGTDNDIELTPNTLIVEHSAFPLLEPHVGEPGYDPEYRLPSAKILGGARGRAKAFRPASVVNVSAMSFGSLSGPAIEALNRGCQRAGCLHNTGEGGISPYHRKGGDLIWQLGTGYFGCRDEHGGFSLERLLEAIDTAPVKALEIKLSQGAKPGLGGVLPKAKITPEIAGIRLVEPGQDVISPARHTAFDDVDGLLDFVELLADRTGLPVGIKSAVGGLGFWRQLAQRMRDTGRGVDFINIDGGEGGTGAAPLTFSDHVSLPFKVGMSSVYPIFAETELADDVVWIGSGKLGFPADALLAFALGCDLVAVAREAMLAIGCIQAQICHTDRCPTGVATHNRWLQRGVHPPTKAESLANYVRMLRKDLLRLSRACGVPHPALVGSDRISILDAHYGRRSAREVFGYEPSWGTPSEADRKAVEAMISRSSDVPQGGH